MPTDRTDHSGQTVWRVTADREEEMTGSAALLSMARDLMAGQARGEVLTVALSQDGRVTLRTPNGTKVSYCTGIHTDPYPTTKASTQ